jgi:alkylated DNA nucleotide flippase Atl1
LAALHPNPISIGLVSLAGGVAGASAIKHFIDGDKLHEKHGMLDQKQQQHTPDPQPHSTKTPLTPPDHAAIKKFMEGATRFDAVAGGQKAATTPPAKRPAARALGRAHSFLARNVVAPTHRVVQKVGDARIGAAGALVTAGHVTEVALHPAAPAVALATLAVVSSSIALGKHRAHNAHKRMQQHKDTPTESAAKPKGVAGVQAAADKTPNSQQHGAEKQKTSRLVKMAAVHKQSKDPTGKGRK